MIKKIINLFFSDDNYLKSDQFLIAMLGRYEHIDGLLKYFSQAKSYKSFETKRQITFKNDVRMGDDVSGIINKLGRPLYSYDNPYIKKHSMLYYKLFLKDQAVRAEFHLFNNSLFMIRYSLAATYFSNEYFTSIKKIISEKYFLDQEMADENLIFDKICINDDFSNSILVNEETFYLTLTYLNKNKEVETGLNQVIAFNTISHNGYSSFAGVEL